jgi:hypothetical protein
LLVVSPRNAPRSAIEYPLVAAFAAPRACGPAGICGELCCCPVHATSNVTVTPIATVRQSSGVRLNIAYLELLLFGLNAKIP